MSSEKSITIQLFRSPIGRLPKHRATLLALGLRKIGHIVKKPMTPVTMGMIKKVAYLLKIKQ